MILFFLDSNGVDLDAYLDDVRTLLGIGMSAIATLRSTSTFTTPETRHYMRNAANIFGTSYYDQSTTYGMSSEDKDKLSKVSATIGDIQTLLSGNVAGPNSAQLGNQRTYLSCSDSSYISTDRAQDINGLFEDGVSTQQACRHRLFASTILRC